MLRKLSLLVALVALSARAERLPELAGEPWESYCSAENPRSPYGVAQATSLRFEGDELFEVETTYGDTMCLQGAGLTRQQVYRVAGVDASADGRRLSLTYVETRLTPGTVDVAAQLNAEGLCGISDWRAGVERACQLEVADIVAEYALEVFNEGTYLRWTTGTAPEFKLGQPRYFGRLGE